MSKLNIFQKANQVRQSVQAEATDKLQATYISLMNAARKVVRDRDAIVNTWSDVAREASAEARRNKRGIPPPPDSFSVPRGFQKYNEAAMHAKLMSRQASEGVAFGTSPRSYLRSREKAGKLSLEAERTGKAEDHLFAANAHADASSRASTSSTRIMHQMTEQDHLKKYNKLGRQQGILGNSNFTNPDGTFKIVNGSQLNAAIALFVSKGHSEASATRLANSISNPNGNGAADIGAYGAVGPTDNPPKDGEKELPGEKEGVKEACCKADKASEAAERDNTPESHENAHNAHQDAAAVATKFGDTDKASKHTAKATEHKGKAQTQREAAPQVA